MLEINKGAKLKVIENGWWKGLTVDDECLVTAVEKHHVILTCGAQELKIPKTMLDDFEVVS